MAELIRTIYDPIERAFDSVGLMSGTMAPLKRFVVVGLGAAFLVYYLQPTSMFQAGTPRPWSVVTSGDTGQLRPTRTPWFGVPLIAAFAAGFLI
jgi:hypothetical protein